jgi:hypothetical protein
VHILCAGLRKQSRLRHARAIHEYVDLTRSVFGGTGLRQRSAKCVGRTGTPESGLRVAGSDVAGNVGVWRVRGVKLGNGGLQGGGGARD